MKIVENVFNYFFFGFLVLFTFYSLGASLFCEKITPEYLFPFRCVVGQDSKQSAEIKHH